MIRKEQDGIQWLEFELLNEKRIKHAVFLRQGGSSIDPFDSLNLGKYTGDSLVNINNNIKKIKSVLQVDHLVTLHQQHGSQVIALTADNANQEHKGDALVTATPEIGLMITHADCQAAIFYDPIQHVVANVHSGWRGSVQNIYANTIRFMQERFRTLPSNLLVCISPSLGPDDAEFLHYRHELPSHFWPFQIKPHYFNFWEISQMQLIESGVLVDHIQIAGISTFSHPEDYFSYRREKVCGRNGTVVFLI